MSIAHPCRQPDGSCSSGCAPGSPGWRRWAGTGAVLPLGLPGIDRALPGGGLTRGCLHELCGAPDQGAALGFAAVLLGRLMAEGGHVVWIGPRDELFGPGLAELGLPPERLIVVRARPSAIRLWALEEALRSPGLAAALAEVDQLSLSAEPAAAARRRGQRRDRLAAAPPGRRRDTERCGNALADRGSAQRGDRRTATSFRPLALADRPVPLSRRSHRQLADRLARGWLA